MCVAKGCVRPGWREDDISRRSAGEHLGQTRSVCMITRSGRNDDGVRVGKSIDYCGGVGVVGLSVFVGA